MPRLMIIDDDKELCVLLKEYFSPEGYECIFFHNGLTALNALNARDELKERNELKERKKMEQPEIHPDLILLDVMLPGKMGFELLSAIRSNPEISSVPVIMLTALENEANRILGLEMGADDYVPKPFSPRELLARIRAVLRRTQQKTGEQPDIRLFYGTRTAFVQQADGNMPVPLSAQEYSLLQLLLDSPGEVLSRERLSREALGRSALPYDHSLEMQISRLRKKLGPLPDGTERIRAVRGEGYYLAVSKEKYQKTIAK